MNDETMNDETMNEVVTPVADWIQAVLLLLLALILVTSFGLLVVPRSIYRLARWLFA